MKHSAIAARLEACRNNQQLVPSEIFNRFRTLLGTPEIRDAVVNFFDRIPTPIVFLGGTFMRDAMCLGYAIAILEAAGDEVSSVKAKQQVNDLLKQMHIKIMKKNPTRRKP